MRSKNDPNSLISKGQSLASLIQKYYIQYGKSFYRLTLNSKAGFENRDWPGVRKDAIKRLNMYETFLDKIESEIYKLFGQQAKNISIWKNAKKYYRQAISDWYDLELAETFFNSVTRKILMTTGINRKVEFFQLRSRKFKKLDSKIIYRTYNIIESTKDSLPEILSDFEFKSPFEDIKRDSEFIANEIDLYLWPFMGGEINKVIEMINVPFYRNKVAYLVGRILAKGHVIPLVLPLYNSSNGIFVDAVLFRKRQLSIIFGFAHTCFHVPTERHKELIEFLLTILPVNRIDELYFMIGYRKHGKTEFYRDLHHFIHVSKEKFEIAKGLEGSVMIAYTLPNYNYIFKVIKDYSCYLRSENISNKTLSREHVMHCYQCVCNRDRVGRMVDTQEFENLKFRKKRFSSKLLREFKLAARNTVVINEEYVLIKHLYLQRKVTPLPLYLEMEHNPEAIREVIIDYGYFLRDLAAIGIFPADLFNMWNCGVTSRRRVVLFDYDDVESLLNIDFKVKPAPRDYYEELMPDKDRIAAHKNDFFIDEIEIFLGIPKALQGVFNQIHGDLYNVKFWHKMQRKVKRGDIADIIPYNKARRFKRRFDFSHFDISHR